MLVWASKDGWYGYRKVSFGKDKAVDVVLSRSNSVKSGPTYETFDIVPPAEKAVMPKVSPEKAAEKRGNQRGKRLIRRTQNRRAEKKHARCEAEAHGRRLQRRNCGKT
jgi:hypothetical protein